VRLAVAGISCGIITRSALRSATITFVDIITSIAPSSTAGYKRPIPDLLYLD
jgi:hypothetical protein